MSPPPPDPFWTPPASELLAQLGATPSGLTTADASRRLEKFGRNIAAVAPRQRLPVKIAKRLIEPLVAILLIAAAISALTGDVASFVIILVIVVISIALDVFQEYRAEAAAEALRRSVAVRTTVLRDGRRTSIEVEQVAPGDVVILGAGDMAPADGVVLSSDAAVANEALLTGEPYPVEKRPGDCPATTPAEAFNALFGGTALVGGEAVMLVVRTGADTRLGGIAAALQASEPPTAFERGVRALGVLILRLTIFLVLFVLLARLTLGRPALESFLFAVALAVGLTPELLPMVMTVTLSRGALRMAARKVVVKRLAAIHDLGAMDVLCTDKTGTLTEAKIALVGHPGPDGKDSPRVSELSAVNSTFASGSRSPLDQAILDQAGGDAAKAWTRIAGVPFDFERRRVSVLAAKGGMRLLIVKGAPEQMLALCTSVEDGADAVMPLTEEIRRGLVARLDAKAEEGLRCLAVAWRQFDGAMASPTVADEADLVFSGFCVFADPPKPDAAAAVHRLAAAGVRVKVISGDAVAVVAHLVRTLGLPARGLLTGPEIATLSEAKLAARVQQVDLFARVSPDQKTRIIRALQAHGHRVGFLGDGINDAPAIRAADVGLSVDGATDVARAAADMILLSPDLGVLADGVAEGRRTYVNIMKYVRMGTSSNFGNMLSMAVASLFIPFLPLTPIQILLNNLLYDISETGIPFDDVDRSDVAKPHAWDMRAILRFTLIMGPLSSAFDLATFAVLGLGFHSPPAVFRTAWFVESMATQVLVIFLIRTSAAAWASRPHRVLAATSLGALALAFVLALSPLGRVFGFAPVGWPLLGVIGLLVVAYLAAAEGVKRLAMSAGRRRKDGIIARLAR